MFLDIEIDKDEKSIKQLIYLEIDASSCDHLMVNAIAIVRNV